MLLVIGAFFCSFISDGPSNETITKDWNNYFQRNSTKDCITCMTFKIISKSIDKIVSKSVEKSELSVLVNISCDWNAKCDTVNGTKPSKLFMKGTGEHKTAGFKMVYVKEGKDWIFKGFISR
jgi:hypothetical protein